MIRSVYGVTLSAVVCLTAASAVMAGVPNSANSTKPLGIAMVGHNNAADPTAFGAATYTIRDAANNPVQNSVVTINFSSCTDLKLCSSVLATGMTVNCGASTLSGTTNASGQVTMRVVGSSNNGGARRASNACAAVTADGVPMGSLIASAFDLYGNVGVGGNDLFLWGLDFVNAPTISGRSDYDADNVVGGNDVFRWGSVFVPGASNNSCHDCTP